MRSSPTYLAYIFYSVVLLFLFSSCAVIPAKSLNTRQVENTIKLIEKHNGKACIYVRGGAIVGPGHGAVDVIGSIGEDQDGGDCVEYLQILRAKPEI